MLYCNGLFVNGFDAKGPLSFDATKSQKYNGALPNVKGHAVIGLHLEGEVRQKSTFSSSNGSVRGEGSHTFYKRGIIIETKGDRLRLLTEIRDRANPLKRDRINAEISNFRNSTVDLQDWQPVNVWACDGSNLFIMGPGIFDVETVHADSIIVSSSGENAAAILSKYFASQVGGGEDLVRSMLGSASFTKVVNLPQRSVSANDAYECASFGLIMSQIRGHRVDGYTFSELGGEFLGITSVLENIVPGVVELHSLKADFTLTLALSDEDRKIAARIAPYVACKVTPFVSNSTGSKLNNLAFASLANVKGLRVTPDGHQTTLRLGGDMVLLDLDSSIVSLLVEKRDVCNKVANRILYNAQTYSHAASGNSSWATALYSDWQGLPGVIGSLTFGV